MSPSREVAESSLERLAELWRSAWAAPSVESFTRCCTPDVHYEDPVVPEPLETVEALVDQAERVRAALPDMRLERSAPCVVERGHACIPWRMLGTHRGEVASMPPTGRFLIVHGVHYAELSDGRVRRARGFFDLFDAGVQLGLLPRRGSLTESALLLLRGFGLRPRG